jgi:hypothetical protein
VAFFVCPEKSLVSDAARNGLRGGSKPATAGVTAPRRVGQHTEPAAGADPGCRETPADRTIAEFEKNGREAVRLALTHYQGRALADLRVFYRDRAGDLRPTPRGLSLDRALLPELEAAVIALRQAAELEAAA